MAKKYWLKYNAHFFKDSHIIFLKTQKNGYEYIYLWQSLLLKCLEVVDDQEIGFLRLNDKIPYSPGLLAEIFGINIDVVKSAIDIFANMGMLEILTDGTIYIEAIQKMIGRESESAERVRLHRERKKTLLLQCNNDETKSNTIYNKNKKKNNIKSENRKPENRQAGKRKFQPPSLDLLKSYITQNHYNVNPDSFYMYYAENDWRDSQGKPVKNWKQKVIMWHNRNVKTKKNVVEYEDLNDFVNGKQ